MNHVVMRNPPQTGNSSNPAVAAIRTHSNSSAHNSSNNNSKQIEELSPKLAEAQNESNGDTPNKDI